MTTFEPEASAGISSDNVSTGMTITKPYLNGLTLGRRRVVDLLNRHQFDLKKVCDPDELLASLSKG